MTAQENISIRKRNLSSLRSELIRFGLNPKDWQLKARNSSEFLIRSEQDQNFILLGKVQNKKTIPEWHSICLFSL